MLELFKIGLCILGVSIGFIIVSAVIVAVVTYFFGGCGDNTEDEGPLDPPAV